MKGDIEAEVRVEGRFNMARGEYVDEDERRQEEHDSRQTPRRRIGNEGGVVIYPRRMEIAK